MKLSEILSEGLIKLPEKALAESKKFAAYWYLALVKDWIEEVADEDYTKIKQYFDKVCEKHGVKISDKDSEAAGKKYTSKGTKSFVVEIDAKDLPEKYSKNSFHKVWKLKIFLQFSHVKGSGSAMGLFSYGKQAITIPLIHHIGVKSFYKRFDIAKDYIDGKLDKMLGTLEHEMSHAVQHFFLDDLSYKQIDGPDESIKAPREVKYYASLVEFDPMIRTDLSHFRVEMRNLVNSSIQDFKKELRYYVGDTFKPHLVIKYQSKFFLSLKEVAPERWKRAVKLFYIAAEKQYNDDKQLLQR